MLDANALAQLKQLKTDIREDQKIYTGVVKGTNSRFGFVISDTDGTEYFLPPAEMDKCLPTDKVEFQVNEDDKGKEFASIQKLIRSELKDFVGQYQVRGKAHLTQPDNAVLNRALFIPPKERKEAVAGDYIKCRVSKHPFPDGKAQAKITKILGKPEDSYIELEVIKAKHGLYKDFTDKQLAGLDGINEQTINDLAEGRSDLTNIPFTTIDSEYTRDMDDALWAEKTDSGWNLKIAIADPGPILEKLPELEKAAASRSTSTYLLGQTLNMLPSELSQQYCSLLAQETRLSLVFECQLTDQGEVSDYSFTSAIIKSHGKLSYDGVTTFLETGVSNWQDNDSSDDISTSIKELNSVSEILLQRRKSQCLVMEDRKDYDFELDENGHILSIKEDQRQPSRRIVEECMLLINRCGAQFLAKNNIGIFNTQPGFRPEKLEDLKTLLTEKAPELAKLNPENLSDFIELIRKADENYPDVRRVLGKYFGRTELSLSPAPHCAQGFEQYTTISSPIRKYQDLLLHRIITAIVNGQTPTPITEQQLQQLQNGLLASRQADIQLVSWLKCIYMENFINMEFHGEISHLNSTGIGVRLPETGVDGFIDYRKSDKKLSFQAHLMCLDIDKRSYYLGESVKVKVASINYERKQVMFKLIEESNEQT